MSVCACVRVLAFFSLPINSGHTDIKMSSVAYLEVDIVVGFMGLTRIFILPSCS